MKEGGNREGREGEKRGGEGGEGRRQGKERKMGTAEATCRFLAWTFVPSPTAFGGGGSHCRQAYHCHGYHSHGPAAAPGEETTTDCMLCSWLQSGKCWMLSHLLVSDTHPTRFLSSPPLLPSLLQVNTILPPEFAGDSHCVHDLIVSAMAFDTQANRKWVWLNMSTTAH